MIQGNRGYTAGCGRPQHVCRVEAAAQSHFDHRIFHTCISKSDKANGRDKFKFIDGLRPLSFQRRFRLHDLLISRNQRVFRDLLPANLDPLPELHQIRGREQPHPISCVPEG